MSESRTIKSLKNAQVSLFFYVLDLILGFWSRKVFLDYLGAEIMGLDTTAQNLFSFLNLAELGVSMSVTYFLYKPMFYKDHESVNKIVALQGWIYKRVASIIIIGACILMLFFPIFFKNAKVPLWYSYAIFSVILFGSMLGYFINYKSIVLTTDQKGYKVTKATKSFYTGIKILQILLFPIVSNPFIFYLVTYIASQLFGCLWLNKVIKKEYPWLKTKGYNGKKLLKEYPDVLKKTKQLFIHKITTVIVFRSSPIIMYVFSSLTVVAYYGNYTSVLSHITSMINMVFSSMGAAIGNLIASGDKVKILRVFWELYDSRFCISSIGFVCIYFLIHPFFAVWIGEQYILGKTFLVLVIFNSWFTLTRLTVDHYINGYGLFQDVWAPMAEGAINIIGALLFSYFWDFKGVLLGNILSQLTIVCCWKPYMLFKKGLHEPSKLYFLPIIYRHLLIIFDVILLHYIFGLFLPSLMHSYLQFFFYGFIVFIIVSIIILGEFLLFSQGIRDFINRMILLHKGKFK